MRRDAQCFHVPHWVDVPCGIAGFAVDVVHPVLAWVEGLHVCFSSGILDGCLGLEGSCAIECRHYGVNAF
jgi:hypothetical protein